MTKFRNKKRELMTLTPKLDSKYTNKHKHYHDNYTNTNHSFKINNFDNVDNTHQKERLRTFSNELSNKN